MGRKQAREGAVKLFFQMEVMQDFSREALEVFVENFKYKEGEIKYIEDAYTNITTNLDLIDKHIEKNLHGWTIYRLAKLDLAALRIAIYEILYRKDIPVEVSINEAIEIVKKYSNEDAFKFINGVLGGFVRSIEENE